MFNTRETRRFEADKRDVESAAQIGHTSGSFFFRIPPTVSALVSLCFSAGQLPAQSSSSEVSRFLTPAAIGMGAMLPEEEDELEKKVRMGWYPLIAALDPSSSIDNSLSDYPFHRNDWRRAQNSFWRFTCEALEEIKAQADKRHLQLPEEALALLRYSRKFEAELKAIEDNNGQRPPGVPRVAKPVFPTQATEATPPAMILQDSLTLHRAVRDYVQNRTAPSQSAEDWSKIYISKITGYSGAQHRVLIEARAYANLSTALESAKLLLELNESAHARLQSEFRPKITALEEEIKKEVKRPDITKQEVETLKRELNALFNKARQAEDFMPQAELDTLKTLKLELIKAIEALKANWSAEVG